MAAVRGLTWEECQRFEYHALALGTMARLSLHSYFLVGKVRPDDASLAVYRRYLATALVMVTFYERLLDDAGAEHLFVLNGQYLSWRVAVELGRSRGLNVVTWEVGQLPDTIFLCANGPAAFFGSAPELWKERGAGALSAEHRQVIERHLAVRRGGDQGIVRYNSPDPRVTGDALRSSLGIAPEARVIALFTNVEWDSAVVDRHRPSRTSGTGSPRPSRPALGCQTPIG